MLNLKPPRHTLEGIVSKRAGILERKEPAVVEVEEPGVREDITHAS